MSSTALQETTEQEVLAPLRERLSRMETASLRQELAKAITVTAETLVYMAAVWYELERRGEDLSDLRSGIANYLPLIASGHLDAEAVVTFAGQPALIRAVATLPVEEQRRLARGASIPVAVIDGRGEVTAREVPPSAIDMRVIGRIIVNGRIRTVEEQKALGVVAMREPAKKGRPGNKSGIVIDRLRGAIAIGGKAKPLTELLAAVVRECPARVAVPADGQVPPNLLVLTADEAATIRTMAKRLGLSADEAVRAALVLAGLI